RHRADSCDPSTVHRHVPGPACSPQYQPTHWGSSRRRDPGLVTVASPGQRVLNWFFLDDVEQPEVGDLGDLHQRGGLLGGWGVLETGVARPEDCLLGVLTYGDDQREAELLPVRGSEIAEVVDLVAVESVESGERLVLHR